MSAESLFFWVAVVGYAFATLAFMGGLMFRRDRLLTAAFAITAVALVAHSASIGVRWASSGRLPFILQYENVLAGTWFIVLSYLALGVWRPALRVAGIAVLPFALLSLGWSVGVSHAVAPVTPAYKSTWLWIHVLFAWATYAAYTSAAGLAVVELLKSRADIRPGSVLERAPSVPDLQDLTLRLVAFGFLVNGVMIASGSIWAYELWGSYWRWDPVETWTLLTWLAFGFYMHASLTLGWRGKRLAWLAIFALFGVMMSFWGVQFLPSLFGVQTFHRFDAIGPGAPR